MKKKYIIPALMVTKICIEAMIAESLGFKQGSVDNEESVLVKGTDASPRSDYNVWNDDWSK